MYKNKRLERNFSSLSNMQMAYGRLAKRIDQRMQQLDSAANLSDIQAIRSTKLHQLQGKDKGLLSISISGNWRIVFEPIGGSFLDYETIEVIKIEKVVDYH